jgi:glycosyltransferase involved in cell wall biosynthesis
MGMKALHLNSNTILHLIDSGGVYGIERMIIGLLPKLKQRGYDVALACLNVPKHSGTGIKDIFSGSEVNVFCPNFSDKFGLVSFLYLFKITRFCNPKIIHLHGYKATIVGGCFTLLMRIPCVATYHIESKYLPNLAKYVKIETQVLRKIRGIAAVSDPIKKELEHRGVSDGRIRVIPNGIDDFYMVEKEPKNYFKNGKRDPLVLFVGRLIEKKNIHVLINAIARLKKKFPRIRLLVAGEGPYKKELVNQVRRLDLIKSVNFLGYVDDTYSLYKMCDCFVLPSKTEGMPIALLEAMACKLPIIASAVGSVPKIVTHEVDALLIEPDNEEELYQALWRLLSNPLLKKDLGGNARKNFLINYTSDLMADRYKEFYDRILTIR